MKTLSVVRFRSAALALTAAGVLLSGVSVQAQPTITGIYPDGSLQFQWTNSLAFTITSTAAGGITSLSVNLTGTNLQGQVLTPTNLTAGAGLIVTGPTTAETVNTPLTSNINYYATITAVDANGTLTFTNGFDTVIPVYTWEGEDYDYSGGQFIDNPQLNLYAGLVATINVDAYSQVTGAGAAYRPIMSGGDTGGDVGNEVNGDKPRAQYTTNGQTDYDQGWSNGGVWANYTRHYPAGKWNIIARAAGNTGGTRALVMYQGGINGTLLGQFNVPNTASWQVYTWTPLADVAGNPLEWDTDGSKQTLTMAVGGGGFNINYYMLTPINPNYKPLPFVSGANPNGSVSMFNPTNVFSFTANSVTGLTSNSVVVTLNGIPAYGVTYSGGKNDLLVSCPIATNSIYTAVVTLTDNNGTSTFTTSFGTFASNNYTWEAEDWDYTNGLFFDNPQVNKYAGLLGTPGVDGNNNQGGNSDYRPAASGNGDLGNEVTGDVQRAQYKSIGSNDYDAGWTAANQWANYTRTYPKGSFYVYMRGASPNGQTDTASLAQVTSGVGTSTQTTNFLGKFNVPLTGGWQNWTWVPMVNPDGSYALITNSGAVSTLQMHEDNGGFNANFFMLVTNGSVPFPPIISQIYPNTLFQRTNTLSFVVTSQVPLTANNITLTLNGAVVNNLTVGGSPTSLTVSWPYLQPDTYYNATIAVSSPNNVTAPATSLLFDTFGTNYYTFEAEDFDHDGGQFYDNPQIDDYAHYNGQPGIDCTNTSTGGFAYRADDAGDLDTEVTGDTLRAQYVAAGAVDYDIGWTAAGNWANYTRTYPAGLYNFYMRVASPSGQTDAARLFQVTAGLGTTNQTTNFLGTFNAPATGGYQNWGWVPLVNATGKPVNITTSGRVSTFQMVEDNGGFNANFFMLVPAPFQLSASVSGSTVTISFPSQVGHTYQIQYKVHLTDATWTALGNPVTGTGGIVSVTDTISGSTRFYSGIITH